MIHDGDRIPGSSATRHRDYILTDYEPRRAPEGRLHSAAAFRHALREAGLLDRMWPIIETLQAHLGPDEIVWGVKYTPSGFSTELYFYNNANNPEGHPMQVTTLQRILAEHLRVGGRVDERIPYFMCSLDLGERELDRRASEGFRIYNGSGERHRKQCGFSYLVADSGTRMENHYWFYPAADPDQIDDARRRLQFSCRSGSESHWPELIPDYLTECHTICYAVKPEHDGLYFSRLSSEQLLTFLELHLPGTFRDLLYEHEDEFAHLRWDLGYDFHIARHSAEEVKIDKIGIYGFC